MKHFEDIWNESEELQDETLSEKDRLQNIHDMIGLYLKDNSDHKTIIDLLKAVMYELTGLTKDLKLNVAAIMMHHNEDKKVDRYN